MIKKYFILCVYNNKNNNYLLYIFIGLELYHLNPNQTKEIVRK